MKQHGEHKHYDEEELKILQEYEEQCFSDDDEDNDCGDYDDDFFDYHLDMPTFVPDQVLAMSDFTGRVLWLTEEIGSNLSTCLIRRIIKYNRQDAGLPVEKRQPILLYINCNGGEISSSFALHDAILASKTPVYGITMGYAFSGGFYVLLACAKRFGMKRSWYLLHRGSGANPGLDHLSASRAQKQWDAQVEDMAKMVEEHTHIPRPAIENYMLTDSYFNAQDALTLGIIDKIIDTVDDFLPHDEEQ